MAEKIPYGNKSLKSDPGTANDTVREQTAEPSIEEMARELGLKDCPAPDKAFEVCLQDIGGSCQDCWLNNATPSEIRTRYQQLEGERG